MFRTSAALTAALTLGLLASTAHKPKRCAPKKNMSLELTNKVAVRTVLRADNA